MAIGLDDQDFGKEVGGGTEELKKFLKCILRNFSHISKKRLHNLAFLSEYVHYTEHNERISSADYRPYLQGCHSEKIESTLGEIEDIEVQGVKIRGERVKTLKIKGEFECELSQKATNSIKFVTEKYGEVSPEEITKAIFKIDCYMKTGSGEVIDFQYEE